MADPLSTLTDTELEGLLQIAKEIYKHTPVELDVAKGEIVADANVGNE